MAKNLLSSDDLKPRNVKERITTMIDQDVVDELRRRAAKAHKGYQTLLNEVLRASLFGEDDAAILSGERLADLEEQVKHLQRLASGGADLFNHIKLGRRKVGSRT